MQMGLFRDNVNSIPTSLSSDDLDKYDQIQGMGVILPGGKSQLKSDGSGVDIRHSSDEGIEISPSPGFVLKTLFADGKATKVFINICYHDEIEPPGKKKKLDEDGNEVEGLNVPLSMSPIRSCDDKMSNDCLVVDAIVHPSVKDDMETDRTGAHRDLLCNILLQCFDQKYPHCAPLDRKYKLPRLVYFGYIDSRTGQTVRKQGVTTEVYKQCVRRRINSPKIEEIQPLPNSTTAITPTLSSNSNASDNSLKKVQEQADETKLEKLEYQIFVSTSSYGEFTLVEFIELANSQLFCGKEEYSNFAPPINQTNGLTLLLDAKVTEDIAVSSIRVCFSLSSFDEITTKVESSAYMFYIHASNFQQTKVILPFCIDPATTTATYNKDKLSLNVNALVSQTRIEDEADIGSKPWILARGLSTARKGSHKENNKEKNQNIMSKPEQEANPAVDIDDPYHTRPLYLRPKKKNDTADDKVLPEDRFHATDTLSQHWMHQQEKERNEKVEAKEKERKERESDESVEFLSTADFKPFGKYYRNRSTNKATVSSTDGNDEHQNILAKAEAGLRKKYKSSLNSNMLWSQLF